MMEIIYIFHSSFLIRTPEASVIFDFWKDPEGRLSSLVPADRPLYVVVSHHHKDHYNPEIFRWADSFNDVHYILSADTFRMARHFFSMTSRHSGPHLPLSCLTVLSPGESFSDSRIRIDAFGSTDIGNSYLLRIGAHSIFHAGDLNAWIWKDESSPEEVEEALKAYVGVLNPIAEQYPEIDTVLFPVDSRIGTDYFCGAKILLEKIKVKFFIPMHYGLGTPEQQLRHRIDAASFLLYRNPLSPTVMAGPFMPYGSLLIP